jgi:hypothetical protein
MSAESHRIDRVGKFFIFEELIMTDEEKKNLATRFIAAIPPVSPA